MKMDKINAKDITLMDEVETEEAVRLKKEAKVKYIWLFIAPLIVYIAFWFPTCCFFPNRYTIGYVCLVIEIISLIAFLVGLIVYIKKIRPYKKLLKIAKNNDRIRYEERVRMKERRRLEQEGDREYTSRDVDKTVKKYDEN